MTSHAGKNGHSQENGWQQILVRMGVGEEALCNGRDRVWCVTPWYVVGRFLRS